MPLWKWSLRPNVKQISSWAVEVARRCQLSVAARLGDSIHSMSLPEARGYIRARSAAVIDGELALARQRTGCQPALAATVRERAIDEVTRMAIGDLLRASRQIPLVRETSRLRKAA